MKLNISRTLALALVTMGALGGIACSGASNLTPPENNGGAIGLGGLTASGGTQGVGRSTTKAVVVASVWIFIITSLLDPLFVNLG